MSPRMPNAIYVGGGTGAGKTTLARSLAARHGLRVLQVDSFWYAHAERAGEAPPAPDVQWLEWTPATQAADFERVSRRMLAYVLEDLSALPDQPAVVVEGPQVLPDALPPNASAVFLVPTPRFQRKVLSPRPMPSSDPHRALAARLVKDRLYADRVAALARERGFPVLVVDGSVPPDAISGQVEDLFAPVLAASVPLNLADVRRWENENAAQNLRAWLASDDLPASAERAFPFACECGRLGCGDRVALTLGRLDARHGAIVAPGHGGA